MTTLKGQGRKILSLGPKIFTHFNGKFSRRPRIQERALLGLRIRLGEYTRKANLEIYLPPKSCCNFT